MQRRTFVSLLSAATVRVSDLASARGLESWVHILDGSDAELRLAESLNPPGGLLLGAAGDEVSLEWARKSIETLRKGTARIRVVDRDSNPLAGVRIQARHVRHEFLFGVNLVAFRSFSDPDLAVRFENYVAKLFNLAVIPFYWGIVEPDRNGVRFERLEAMTTWALKHRLVVKGHPLLWATPGLGWPAWMDRPPSGSRQLEHVRAVLSRYGERVRQWDVVNEPTHFSGIDLPAVYRLVRQIVPSAHLIVNDFGGFLDPRQRLYALLARALADGLPFDGIGLQAHEPPNRGFPLPEVRSTLDRFAVLGKGLHLSELAFGSNGRSIDGSRWRGVWSEEEQAAYVEDFYRVAFAHPAVESVVWWVVVPDKWRPGAELLRADMTPKPVYERLERLINVEWRSGVGGAVTDGAGEARFRGFFGWYELSLSKENTQRVQEFHLHRGGENVVTVNWLS